MQTPVSALLLGSGREKNSGGKGLKSSQELKILRTGPIPGSTCSVGRLFLNEVLGVQTVPPPIPHPPVSRHKMINGGRIEDRLLSDQLPLLRQRSMQFSNLLSGSLSGLITLSSQIKVLQKRNQPFGCGHENRNPAEMNLLQGPSKGLSRIFHCLRTLLLIWKNSAQLHKMTRF